MREFEHPEISVQATQGAVVPNVLVRLGVPSVLVGGGEVEVGVVTLLGHEVRVVHGPPRRLEQPELEESMRPAMQC